MTTKTSNKNETTNGQKPFEIAFSEFNNNLVKLIETSSLPPAVIAQSLQLVLGQVNQAAEAMYRKAVESEKEVKEE